MREIKVGEKVIKLNIGESLTVREMRLIYPISKKHSDNEIELSIAIIKALSDQEDVEEIINSLSIEEFEDLSQQFVDIFNFEKKK